MPDRPPVSPAKARTKPRTASNRPAPSGSAPRLRNREARPATQRPERQVQLDDQIRSSNASAISHIQPHNKVEMQGHAHDNDFDATPSEGPHSTHDWAFQAQQHRHTEGIATGNPTCPNLMKPQTLAPPKPGFNSQRPSRQGQKVASKRHRTTDSIAPRADCDSTKSDPPATVRRRQPERQSEPAKESQSRRQKTARIHH